MSPRNRRPPLGSTANTAADLDRGRSRGRGATPSDLTAVDRIVATLRPLGLDAPVVIAPPDSGFERLDREVDDARIVPGAWIL